MKQLGRKTEFYMSSPFAAVFEITEEFLRSRDIEPHISKVDAASDGELEKFHAATGVSLPNNFAAFHLRFSDGFEFSWSTEDCEGRFAMPSLRQLVTWQKEWIALINEFANDPKSLDKCVAPEHRPDAFRIWESMKEWIPFAREPDGGSFCVRLDDGAIVYNNHDWFDGFGQIAETNGLIAGDSLLHFIKDWAIICFSPTWFGGISHHAGKTHLDWKQPNN